MPKFIADNAAVDRRAQIDDDVEIGPFSVVGPDVVVGRGTRIANNVTLTGRVTIGQRNQLFPGVAIGCEPQDLSFKGTDSEVIIGDDNVFRENTTVHRATDKEQRVTAIGSNCYFMSCSHVAHDCMIGDHVVMASGALLAGHVHVHDHATLSGNVAVHHFTTIGSYTFTGGLSRIVHDVPPFMLVEGSPARARCVNVVALKRNDFPGDVIKALNEAYRLIYRAKVGLDQARDLLRSGGHFVPQVNELFSFLEAQQEGRHGRHRELRRAA